MRFNFISTIYYETSRYYVIGASLSEPHINGTAMRAIYGICIYVYMVYVYMYICMVRPSSARRFIDSVLEGKAGRMQSFVLINVIRAPLQDRMQSFVLKSLRSKKNCYSMQCIFVKDSRHTFRIYAYSNLANRKFTLVRYTVLQCQSARHQRNQASTGNSAPATARKIEDL